MKRAVAILVVLCACSSETRNVEAWLASWETARRCLLGPEDHGADIGDSSVVASLISDTRCVKERLGLLSLTDKQRDTIPQWVSLWNDINTLTVGGEDPSVIARLDGRANELRERLGLPALRRVQVLAPAVVPAAVGVPGTLQGGLPASALATEHTTGNVQERAEYESVGAVRRFSFPAAYALSFPSRRWAAGVESGALITFDLQTAQSKRAKFKGAFRMLRAMDRDDGARAVFLELADGRGFAVAVSSDLGATWRVERRPGFPLSAVAQDPSTGVVDIVTGSMLRGNWYRFDKIAPWSFPAAVEIPRFDGVVDCSADGAFWMQPRNGAPLLRVSPRGPDSLRLHDAGVEPMADCRGTAALAISRNAFTQTLHVCRGYECSEALSLPHGRDSAAAFDGASWMFAAVRGAVVGLWRENVEAPQFFRLPVVGRVVKLFVLQSKPHLLLKVGDDYQLVPLVAANKQ